MPSQEPQLGDKNDEVDLPSEENDGSEYSSVKMEFLFFLICRFFRSQYCNYTVNIFVALKSFVHW